MWQVVYRCKETSTEVVIAEDSVYMEAATRLATASSALGLFQGDCFAIPDKPARLPSVGVFLRKV